MKARERDQKIVIERKSVTTDDYGNEVESWTTFATEWAKVVYGTGREQREAAQVQASLPATFEVDSNSNTRSATELDRINFDSAYWNIVAPPNDLGLNKGVRITAVRG